MSRPRTYGSASDTDDESRPMLGDSDRTLAQRLRSAVTVEPIAFLYILPFVLSTSTNQQYASYYHALALGGDPELLEVGLCSIGDYNNTDWVATVQSAAATYLTIFSFLNNLPMIMMALLMGSYSDSRGRKIAMCLPVIGGIIRAVVSVIVVSTAINLEYMYIAAFLEGLFGGSAVVTLALYAYIADVSSVQKRSWRMLLLMVTESLGIAMAEISAGYMITDIGFIYPYVIILSCYCMCLLMIVFYVAETVQEKLSDKDSRKGYFEWHHFKRTFGLLIRNEKTGMTWVIRAAVCITFLVYMTQSVNAFGLYLYVAQYPLCFTWVQVGYLIATVVVFQSAGGPLFFRFMHGRFQDLGLLMIGALDGMISQAYLAIPVMTTAYIFSQPAIAFLATLVMPLSRALMSRSVGPNEQGASQALASVCNIVGNTIGSVSAAAVYSATAASFTGSVFLLGSGVYASIFTLSGILLCKAGDLLHNEHTLLPQSDSLDKKKPIP